MQFRVERAMAGFSVALNASSSVARARSSYGPPIRRVQFQVLESIEQDRLLGLARVLARRIASPAASPLSQAAQPCRNTPKARQRLKSRSPARRQARTCSVTLSPSPRNNPIIDASSISCAGADMRSSRPAPRALGQRNRAIDVAEGHKSLRGKGPRQRQGPSQTEKQDRHRGQAETMPGPVQDKARLAMYSPANQWVSPLPDARRRTRVNPGRASTSLRKASAHAFICGNSPR